MFNHTKLQHREAIAGKCSFHCLKVHSTSRLGKVWRRHGSEVQPRYTKLKIEVRKIGMELVLNVLEAIRAQWCMYINKHKATTKTREH
ncbi:hypothetical protein VN97_g600 [Penicillium thymicola]|uniref:Uncharacterized protein n=1 Tax=Penicillium thymicola TaxID=293382 RepID=A0AAI9TSI2_PENTH|nr:hypothetical protein VN97_g600 [Penicillium thymicola]